MFVGLSVGCGVGFGVGLGVGFQAVLCYRYVSVCACVISVLGGSRRATYLVLVLL